MGESLRIFIRTWAPTPRATILTRTFIGSQAILQVFRGFQWLSNVSGRKGMAKKTQLIHIS